MASAVVELNQQISVNSLASKSARPHALTIDSIPLKDPCEEKKTEVAVKCNHFSIRGYVAEVRKKDRKLCDPFLPGDLSADPPHELPPMVIPKFRWWQCDGCVPGASSSGTCKGQKPADAADPPTLAQEKSKLEEAPTQPNAEASTSTDSNDNKKSVPNTVLADRKGKGKLHVEDEIVLAPQTGFGNGFMKRFSSQGNLQQNAAADEVVLRSDFVEVRNIESDLNNCTLEGNKTRPPKEYMNSDDGNASEQQPSVVKKQASSEVAGIVNGRMFPLPDLNECSGEPSDYDDRNNLVTENNNINHSNRSNNINLCEEDDDYLGTDRRKTPKVRLLSELLGVKEKSGGLKLKKKKLSLSTYPGPKSTLSDYSQAQSPGNESGKRKRSCSQDEESKSVEIKILNNGTKKLRTPRAEVSESETEDESAEIISEALAKRRKCALLEKGNNKKLKVDHGRASSSSVVCGQKGKSTITVKPHSDRKSDVFAHVSERNLYTTKKKGKTVQSGKEKTSTGKDKESMQKGNEPNGSEPNQDTSAGKGKNHFLDCGMSVGNDQMHAAPPKDGFFLLRSSAEPMSFNGSNVQKNAKRGHGGQSSSDFSTAQFLGSRLDENRERSVGPKTNLKGKHVWVPEVLDAGPTVQHKAMEVSNSVTNQKEQKNEVRGRMQDIDINSIPTEQASGDDIPMDIVELLAKKQYERNQSDPKDRSSPTSSLPNYDKNTASGENTSKSAQSPFLHMQKPLHNDPKNGIVNSIPDTNPTMQKLWGAAPFSDFNRTHVSSTLGGHLRENQFSTYSPLITAQNCFPSYLREVEAYNRYRACAPRTNTDTRVWPSLVAGPSRMPLGITNPEMISHSSNVLNKGKILNFSIAANQNLNFSSAYNCGGHQTENSASAKQSKQAGGPVDSYTSDAISAVRLLSLMQNQARVRSGMGLSIDGKVDPIKRPPLPPDHHHHHQYKQETGPQKVMMGPTSSSHPCYPTIPTFGSSFQNDGCIVGRNFVGAIPLTSRGQRNIEGSHFGYPGSGDHLPHERRLSSSGLDKGKSISSIWSAPATKNSPNFMCTVGVRRDEKTVCPNPQKEICVVNRNPSEFTDLREMSRYMIGREDLRPKGLGRDREKSARSTKRHEMRMNKVIPPGKERQRKS